jgi:hypothetical protein
MRISIDEKCSLWAYDVTVVGTVMVEAVGPTVDVTYMLL